MTPRLTEFRWIPTPFSVPVCRASKLRWWSLPLHTASDISALSAVCGPGRQENMFTFVSLSWCLKVNSQEGAHLPSSGVGLHHSGGALDLLIFCLLLQDRQSKGSKLKLIAIHWSWTFTCFFPRNFTVSLWIQICRDKVAILFIFCVLFIQNARNGWCLNK